MEREDLMALQKVANYAQRRADEVQDQAEREHWLNVMAENARRMADVITSKQ